MTNLKRPLSPHLQIYKPQLTSVLSIAHRITGVILSILSLFIPLTLLSVALGIDYFNILKVFLANIFIQLLITASIFVLAYHLLNGIRHLFWDYGLGLSMKDTYVSGYLVLIVSVLLTLLSIIFFEINIGF
ncbi:MAG: succinate dehydrogenase, cytochrome b556 subunit [Pelagibacterales bacterium]|nr:succinate dehydrogenase, cytochrome b556 subunit [Pelagibacterales bacterium]